MQLSCTFRRLSRSRLAIEMSRAEHGSVVESRNAVQYGAIQRGIHVPVGLPDPALGAVGHKAKLE